MVEVTIEDVVVRTGPDGEPDLAGRHRIVQLRAREGDRVLWIWIGPPEGDVLALQLGGASTPRPLTVELATRLLEASGGTVERVEVSSLRENTFHAVVHLRSGAEPHAIDARPSDALNLAARVGAPIFVDTEVMDAAGVPADRSLEKLEEECERLGIEQPGGWLTLTPELVMAGWPRPPGGERK